MFMELTDTSQRKCFILAESISSIQIHNSGNGCVISLKNGNYIGVIDNYDFIIDKIIKLK